MKVFVLLALATVALAEPEADPQVLLSPLVKHLYPTTHYQVPLTHQVVNPVHHTQYALPHYPVVPTVEKVEKEEEEVQKAVTYAKPVVGTPLSYTYQTAPVHPVHPVQYVQPQIYTAPVVPTVVKPVQKVYHAKNGVVEHKVFQKREADPVDYVTYNTGVNHYTSVPTLQKVYSAYNKVPVVHHSYAPTSYIHPQVATPSYVHPQVPFTYQIPYVYQF